MQERKIGAYVCFRRAALCILLFTATILLPATHCQSTSVFPWELFLPSFVTSSATLSPAQTAFVKQIGYPQQFTKTFSYENGVKRIDEHWIYTELKVVEYFVNGIFVSEETFSYSYPKTIPNNKPYQFSFNTTMHTILSKFGEPSTRKDEFIWNGMLTTLSYQSIYVVFNNEQIVSVTSLR